MGLRLADPEAYDAEEDSLLGRAGMFGGVACCVRPATIAAAEALRRRGVVEVWTEDFRGRPLIVARRVKLTRAPGPIGGGAA